MMKETSRTLPPLTGASASLGAGPSGERPAGSFAQANGSANSE
jgi:hypothetical protein